MEREALYSLIYLEIISSLRSHLALQREELSHKGMVSTRVGLMRNEVAGQSEGPIGTLKIGVKSATELEIF